MQDLFFLTVLFIIGAVVAYQDIVTGKVRNRLIVIGLSAGALGYLFLVIGALLSADAGFVYLRRVLINVSLAWAVSFIIWYFGLWSAGDAKFFMLLSFLLPLKYYGDGYATVYFPSFILFFNTFIFVLLFILLEIFFKMIVGFGRFVSGFRGYRDNLKEQFYILINRIKKNKIRYLRLTWGYLCLFALVRIAGVHLREKLLEIAPVFENFIFIVMILLFRPLYVVFRKMKAQVLWLFTVILAVYFFYYIYGSPGGQDLGLSRIIGGFVGFMVVLSAVRMTIKLYLGKKEIIKIGLDKLKPKMVLTEDSAKKINRFLNEEKTKEKFYPDGLTLRQVDRIRNLSWKTSDLQELSIYKTFALAPFIFLGALATIFTRGPVLDFSSFISWVKG